MSETTTQAESTPPVTVFALLEDEPVGQGISRIMLEQIDSASWHLKGVPEAAEHVHEVRKATKRVRAMFRMVRDALGEDTYTYVNVTVRDVARELSQARSSVVQIGVLEGIVEGDATMAAIAEPLRGRLLTEAEATRAALDDALVGDLSLRLAGVRERIENVATVSGWTAMRSGVQRTYRKGRKAMRRAYAGTSLDEFHVWRKQVKYLRHQMEILNVIGPEIVGDLITELGEMGETLGADNDLADLARTASSGEPWPGRTELLEVIAADRTALEDGLRGRAGQVYAERPAVFADRITQAWA